MKLFKLGDYHISSMQITFIREPVIKGGDWVIGMSDGKSYQVRSDHPTMQEIQLYFRIEDPK